MVNLEIGNRLKDLRLKKEMTQKEVADELHVSFQSISKWELNKSYPDLDNLVKLCQLYDVSLDYVVGHRDKSVFEKFISSLKRSEKEDKKMTSDFRKMLWNSSEYIVMFDKSLELKDFSDYPELKKIAVRWISTGLKNHYLRFQSELSQEEVRYKLSEILAIPEDSITFGSAGDYYFIHF